jgi:hypothetical protein
VELRYTVEFVECYNALPERDSRGVIHMLDRLESEHSKPHMRDMIRIDDRALFATLRFETPSGEYRILWVYEEADETSEFIWYLTVARADRTQQI